MSWETETTALGAAAPAVVILVKFCEGRKSVFAPDCPNVTTAVVIVAEIFDMHIANGVNSFPDGTVYKVVLATLLISNPRFCDISVIAFSFKSAIFNS